ncbi:MULTISPECIES: DUF222 domain-containing protein [unclassified Microbacterium]|uniref:DUF222 domain-containing protein n=1 Tax=unclassified Microbacterium TaxID=2609290 RepID=UPI000928B17F|nr:MULTISPECIES: DUF222 domain-containing protein [unclassified Microbacterium]OJV79395.1 MAG: hypothetical protein BGO46_03475 [Microbacterium sp. 70-16]
MTNVWSAMEDPQQEPTRKRVEFGADDAGSGGVAASAGVDPHWAELSALVARAEANHAEMARLQAERAQVCADALDLIAMRVAQRDAARPGHQIGDTIPLREVLAELSAALRVGERTISNWLGDGAALVSTYTATLEALREGRIDERHASAIIDGGACLSRENRDEYERLILPIAESETAPSTRAQARVIAARLQPDTIEASHRRALEERRVRTYDLDDGQGRLLLDAPAALIHGIFERLTAMGIAQGEVDAAAAAAGDGAGDGGVDTGAEGAGDAEADADAPDERTLDQRRADIMCDMLLTAAPTADGDTELGAIRATVQVTIPILTLAGLDDDPALLDGESPIDPGIARSLAACAPSWQRVMIHPVTHEPLRLDTYRPSKLLRRLIAARDQHCRWPGCRRRARRADPTTRSRSKTAGRPAPATSRSSASTTTR